MKIAVIGAGGVGGIFGGLLIKAGCNVTFFARRDTAAKLKSDGLLINSYLGNIKLKNVNAVDVASSANPMDLIIVAVKAWQVKEILRIIQPMLDSNSAILPLQNGVDAPEILIKEFGAEHVLPGMCRVVAFKSALNQIEHTDVDPFIAFGENDNIKSERVNYISEILRNANITVKVPDDIYSMLWQKFLFVTSTSGIGAVTRIPMGILRKVPETRDLFIRSINEIIMLAEKKNINLPEGIIDKSLDYLDMLKPDSTSSTQRDIMEGRPSELEALNGAVVRMGKELSVKTPVNQFLYSSLLPMELIARKKIEHIKHNYS